jgi:RNA polymerase sigma-70 factor (ECF subfamily)
VNLPSSQPDPIQTLRQIEQQDQDALMLLYQHYGGLVYSLALRVMGEAGLAEEVTQDVFLKIWRKPDRWDPSLGQFSSWLLTITRNAAIDRLRAERRTPSWNSTDTTDISQDADGARDVVGDTLWVDAQLLRRLLAQLPAEQREVILLSYFAGFTHSELSHQLSLPLGTVKTRLRIGLQKLRALWHEATRP